MKTATIKEIIMHELSAGKFTLDFNRDIALAATIVDRSFVRPDYTSRSERWNKQDKTRYAKEVQKVMSTL